MTEVADIESLADRLVELPPGRRLVAVAGPPAAGKSTLTEGLATRLTALGRRAQVVPMDGFHLDNAALDAAGMRARKGAPETFDVDGLRALMARLRAGGTAPYPTFDRAADATVPDGGTFDAEIAVVEGNYLLLDEAPWRSLQAFWDATVMLDVPEEVLRDRLVARWLAHGHTPEEALARAEANDLPNARRTRAGSVAADYTLRTPA